MAHKTLRRTLLGVFGGIAVGCGMAGLIASFILQQPVQLPSDLPPETAAVTASAQPKAASTPTISSQSSPSATPVPGITSTPSVSSIPSTVASKQLCDGIEGTPQHVTIVDLGISADIEVLKAVPTVDGTLGDPDNKRKMGWQRNFPGVKPGACKGTVLMDGHTYADNSAVFKESYGGIPMSKLNKLNMVVKVTTDKGEFFYQIDWQKTVTAEGYPEYARANDVYDVRQQGEERIFFATCSDWNGARHTTETMFAGHRISPP